MSTDALTDTTVAGSAGVPMLTRASAAALPRVNLLPPEIAERRRFRRVQAGMAGAVLAAAGVVGALTVLASGQVTDAQAELDSATAQQAVLQGKVNKLNGVRDVYVRVGAAEGLLTQAMGREVLWSHYLNDLSLTIPGNVWVTDLAFVANPGTSAPATGPMAVPNAIGTVTVSGVAFEYDDVATWLETLGKQKGYVNPYFSTATEAKIGDRRVINFASSATITDAAMSKRYTTPAGGTK